MISRPRCGTTASTGRQSPPLLIVFIALIPACCWIYMLRNEFPWYRVDFISKADQYKNANVSLAQRPSWKRRGVVFLKTHKCASTSVFNALTQYAVRNQLSIALPLKRKTIFPKWRRFSRDMVAPLLGDGERYDMILHHTRYDRAAMRDTVASDAAWVTIVRDPVAMFESYYSYYKLAQRLHVDLERFMRTPSIFFTRLLSSRSLDVPARNPMLYDLGLDVADFDNETEIRQKIADLDVEFDLVMVAEFFPESMVLLKRLLRMRTDDLASLRINGREEASKSRVRSQLAARIRAWNWGDQLLYDRFQRRLVARVAAYGAARMQADVAELSSASDSLGKRCVIGVSSEKKGRFASSATMVKFNVKSDEPECALLAVNATTAWDYMTRTTIDL
ncbi:PREDICTED: galactose-3-O-sulfotransferase 3-like [Priapulus caudatus]|uniref:Galactose-3-O-sulfotransferase 3-like n=1 Tax=Priapulus caudatus TaxID=37621 RepID=A0ABM1FB14_PRICU|nr:PREDICTED: galactose-3-O-sulfotransferase 3-like [Priapulus caudatus]